MVPHVQLARGGPHATGRRGRSGSRPQGVADREEFGP